MEVLARPVALRTRVRRCVRERTFYNRDLFIMAGCSRPYSLAEWRLKRKPVSPEKTRRLAAEQLGPVT